MEVWRLEKAYTIYDLPCVALVAHAAFNTFVITAGPGRVGQSRARGTQSNLLPVAVAVVARLSFASPSTL